LSWEALARARMPAQWKPRRLLVDQLFGFCPAFLAKLD
jgi:hypothetical protein